MSCWQSAVGRLAGLFPSGRGTGLPAFVLLNRISSFIEFFR
jgi:hypothetical protein